jgi:hemerythrin-like domain-containing protein
MAILTQYLHDHHKHCDDLFADAEAGAHAGRWDECAANFKGFRHELEAHFETEEEVLFPAFEAATGMSGGPTQMMRYEHSQMRDLIAQLDHARQQKSVGAYAGVAETLLILMQQHNMKEENILYPMCERAIAAGGINVEAALRERVGAACE